MRATEGVSSASSAPHPRLQLATRPSRCTLPSSLTKVLRRDEPEPSIRDLVNRHRQRLTKPGDLPSLKEIELLLKLERELEAQETLKRLNALTREVR